MFKKIFLSFIALFSVLFFYILFIVFYPKDNMQTYQLQVSRGNGVSNISDKLAKDNIIYNRLALYLLMRNIKLHEGSYELSEKISTWQIYKKLSKLHPDKIYVRIPEGFRFSQMRKIINDQQDLVHTTANLSDNELMKLITDEPISESSEGLFFPDTYVVNPNSSDIQIFKQAFTTSQKRLKTIWENRALNLPYKNPYELLIMSSIIEKETGHEEDRKHVAAVFINRLKIGMKLQTDPTVIYGMGNKYHGKIYKSDLTTDTPYNTYTRYGLPPTPIALPSMKSLEAAAHPSDTKYLYFVSKMDGTGRSEFSHSLNEHNEAVRKYLLKKSS